MPTLDTMLDTMTGRNRKDHVALYNPKPNHKHYDWPSGSHPGAVKSPVENHMISKAKRETFTDEIMKAKAFVPDMPKGCTLTDWNTNPKFKNSKMLTA